MREKKTNQQKFEFLKLFTPPLGEKLLKEILSGHIQDIFKDKFDFICLIRLMRISPPHYHQELIKQMHESITNVLSRRGLDDLIEIYSHTIHEVNVKLDRHIRDIKIIYSNEKFHVELPKSIPNLFIKDGVVCFDDINLEQRDNRHRKLAQYEVLKNDYLMHEKRKLVHDIEDFVLSDLGKNLSFAQQFINLFPESKAFINAWLSEGNNMSPWLFKDWIASQGLNALKIIPIVFNSSQTFEQFRFIEKLPLDIMILKESFITALEKYFYVENTPSVSSKWSIFSKKKSSGFDENLRSIYLAFMEDLSKEKSAEKIVSSIQDFHEKYPQFVHEKLGENIPDSLKIFFPSKINSVTKK
ncbi:MAG: hypothetical protein EBQ95_06585 [Gammaproteobacteria bacterium]|nr:hypothetical protein [Gammaproteobacteria bacterium]